MKAALFVVFAMSGCADRPLPLPEGADLAPCAPL
jgi:hypothetical protein